MSINYKINSPTVIHETIDGEVVVVNLDKKDYYSLLKIAAEIWNRIERGISKENIITELYQQYDCSREEMQNSVDTFLKELQQDQLIVLTKNNLLISITSSYPAITTQVNEKKLKFETPILEKFTNLKDSFVSDAS